MGDPGSLLDVPRTVRFSRFAADQAVNDWSIYLGVRLRVTQRGGVHSLPVVLDLRARELPKSS